ncbi:TetR/AcrR family transcriptional regulator [Granulicoccus phenolivorans]|uniref:TetR/AcrR family transcriptional regulator n=1 Tax=Granulicoccus phenolivorans TaxID=266854 RepID=UPI0003F9EF7D|nr:TetR/AcrR family transcriptional regulator [Granulicoccus phenolivorans]
MNERPYHHGDLRQTLLDAAADVIEESGPAAVSLRNLARRVGVSHAAPAHHFGDLAGLMTALATEGYARLADAVEAVSPVHDLQEAGVAYVSFALAERARFEVMFRPELLHRDDPALQAAQARAMETLRAAVAEWSRAYGGDEEATRVAAWSLVHGFATLWLQGVVPAGLGTDPSAAARAVTGVLTRAE